MSKPYVHAVSSAKKFGGIWEDYIDIHEFLDSSKAVMSDLRHRALTHNSWFISVVIPKIFGEVFCRKSDNVNVSSRDVAEQHVVEDYGNKFIPCATDFLTKIPYTDWMQNGEKGFPDSYYSLVNRLGGVDYSADYSATFTTRTLVDKGYVVAPEEAQVPEKEEETAQDRRRRLNRGNGGSLVVD